MLIKMQWLFIFIFLSIAIGACSNKKVTTSSGTTPVGLPAGIVLGASTETEVTTKLGNPSFQYQPSTSDKSKIYDYQELGSLKFEEGQVKAFFRAPKDQEAKLQFWLQKWANKKTEVEKILSSQAADGTSEFQMICFEEKTTIVYEGETGAVKRVIFYEK